jgi:transcriptional regulator GlxA family with amidase domain
VDAALDEVPAPDVVVMPGGIGTRDMLTGGPYLDWLRAVHPGTRFTTSVCSGSLALAAAGLLNGLTATTHWSIYDYLCRYGAVPVQERVVEHLNRRIITAAGVSSGIDMAIRLVELLVDDVAAQAAQVFIEYDPQPPFDAGHPSKVGAAVMDRVREHAKLRA